MKLFVIVTEYPKATETFIYRDLIKFDELGAQIELHHLAPHRTGQRLHAFAEPTRAWARYTPFAGRKAASALLRAIFARPATLARVLAQIVRAYGSQPKLCLKSLALVPKALAMAVRARREGADHVHAEFAGHPATVAWLMRRFGGPPYSVSCRAHDIFRTQALLDLKLGEAAAVRTVSNYGRRFLAERVAGMAERDIAVIHSSVDVSRIAPVAESPSSDPFRILFVGAMEPKKGVDVLLRALASAGHRLGAWQCDLVGDGPSRGAMEARAGELGLAGRVRFHGALDFDRVAPMYRTASLCVAPSVVGPDGRQEGIPNVTIEALAFQRPAIASALSGIPELIEDGVTGLLVPAGDAAALADAIVRVRSDLEGAFAMAKCGRDFVAAEFDLAVNAARQLALFETEAAGA